MILPSDSAPSVSKGQIDRRLLAGIAALVILAAIAGTYLLSNKPKPVPVPEPVVETPRVLETVQPAMSEDERGDAAREIIDELRNNPAGIDYALAFARAQEFQAAGNFANAQLLYFFAARGGHGPAAFKLASLQDPNHFSAQAGLMDKPDPYQAYKWYIRAREAGNQDAVARLTELRSWAEAAAAANDPNAARLMMQWE